MDGLGSTERPGGTPYPYNTGRVSELLKSKRRFRGIKSCFPCRHRKVRCDGALPCATCVQRGHPELCCAPSASGSVQGSGRSGADRPKIRYGIFLLLDIHIVSRMVLTDPFLVPDLVRGLRYSLRPHQPTTHRSTS